MEEDDSTPTTTTAADGPQVVRVAADELRSFVERCMRAAGCPPEHAQTVADVLVAADLRGVHSHGVNRLEMYVGEIKKGEVEPQIRPQIVNETPAIACVDGRNGLGMVVGRYCMELAIKKAKEMGIGWVVARGSNHYGIAGYYAMMALEESLVGMSYTNTSPIAFPTRAAQHVLGTNPIAVAAPSTDSQGDTPLSSHTTRNTTHVAYSTRRSLLGSSWSVGRNRPVRARHGDDHRSAGQGRDTRSRGAPMPSRLGRFVCVVYVVCRVCSVGD